MHKHGQPARVAKVSAFADRVGYPVILKSDVGSVGKGVVKVDRAESLPGRLAQTAGPYLAQQFTSNNLEFGVFYVRLNGKPRITGINQKHFPTVTGDGERSLGELAKAHPRYTFHWRTFLQYLDESAVPAQGEQVQLSFIGSHTMGCRFTDDTHLVTPALEAAIFSVFAQQPGFNFGRLDVKVRDKEAFQQGEFVVIEVNGVASLPTNMFDPDNTLLQAYRIFLRHGNYLVRAAAENRRQIMPLDSYRNIVRRVRDNAAVLNKSHVSLMSEPR